VRAPIPGGVRGRSLRAALDSERVRFTGQPRYAEWLVPYFRFGGRPVYSVAIDGERPIDAPAPIAAADEDRLAMAGYLPGLFPAGAPNTTLTDDDQRTIADMHRQAALLAGERKFSGAIRLLQEIADAHPDLAAVHYQLGLLLARSGRMDEAVAEFHAAGDLRPDAIDVPHAAEAASQADLAVMLAEDHAPTRAGDAHEVAARVALARKDAAAAVMHAAAAQAANPALPISNYVQGRLLFEAARYDDALARFEDAAAALRRSGGALADLHLYLGDTLARLGRPGEAEPELREELRAFPHNLEAYASLAMLYRSTDRDADVEDVLDELVESTSTPEGYAMAARLWTTLGERSRAEALRSDARARFRGDPSLVLLGRDARR
jgi:tetratricopeptide (TPR) repeat protein